MNLATRDRGCGFALALQSLLKSGVEKGFHHSTDPELRRMSGLQLQRAYANLGQNSESVEVGLELARLFPDDAEVLYCNGKIFGNYPFLSMKKLSEIAPDSIWR